MTFLKNILASFIGILLAFAFIFLIFFIFVLANSGQPEPYVPSGSVLTINLTGSIPERTIRNPIQQLLRQESEGSPSLSELREDLKKAAVDTKIKGILLNAGFVSAPWATLQSVRSMLEKFKKKSGKFIYSTTNDVGYNEKSYFLATAADSIYSPPESYFEFDGFYIQTPFIKGLFDKLGIEPEISRHGKYKSAVEPFLRKNYSPANREQLTALIQKISNTYLDAVSSWSGVSVSKLEEMLNASPHISAKYAYKSRLLTRLLYPDQVKDLIRRKLHLKETDHLHLITAERYAMVKPKSAGLPTVHTNNEIAVIYAEGEIVPFAPSPDFQGTPYITPDGFRSELKKVKDDKNVKALVIRVNSPGGSGSTSDLIWEMINRMKQKMPVITSMGPVAASGGYYISMAADTIVAMPTTITGSIGVFGTKFNMKKLFNNKLGITFDVVESDKNADWLVQTKPFTDTESKAFQGFISDFYNTFLTKVAKSRHLRKTYVDSIGQGHIWTGTAALKNHLVDINGNLDTAITLAARKAGIKSYHIITYPRPKSFFQAIINSSVDEAHDFFDPGYLKEEELMKIREYILSNPRQIQALLPINIDIE